MNAPLGIVDRATLLLDAGEAQDATEAVLLAGGDAGNRNIVEAVQRLHDFLPDVSAFQAEAKLERFRRVTGASDQMIGDLVGLGRRGVQAIRVRENGENLKPRARAALRKVLEGVIAEARMLIVDLGK